VAQRVTAHQESKIMARRKKQYDDEDYDDKMVLVPEATELIVITPFKGFGISYFKESYVNFQKRGSKYYFIGYSGNIISALQSLYNNLLEAEVLKAARKSDGGLSLEDILKIIRLINKQFESLLVKVEFPDIEKKKK
jgi:hypothetical protein